MWYRKILKAQRPQLFILLLISVFLIAAGGLFYYNQYDAFRDVKLKELHTIAEIKMVQVSRWMEERHYDATEIFDSPSVNKYISQWIKNPDDPELKKTIHQRLKGWLRHGTYHNTMILDPQGKMLDSYLDDDNAAGLETRQFARNVAEARQVMVNEIYRCPSCNVVHMDVMLPVISSRDNKVIAVVVLRVNAGDYLFPLVQLWPVPSKTSTVMLLKREGDRMVNMNDLQGEPGTSFTKSFDLNSKRKATREAFDNGEGEVEDYYYNGTKAVSAIRKLPGTSWYLVAKTDASEAYAQLRFLGGMVAVAVVILILLTGSLMLALFMGQRRDYYKKLYQMELDREALVKHFDYIVKYANDIIFLISDDYRIVMANELATQSYGYNDEEILRLKISDIITSDAGKTSESDFKRARETGGTLFETVHRRKDGRVFPVEVSLRSFAIEGKPYYQAIIRDITERKKNEEAVRASEQQKKLILNSVPVAIYTSKLDAKTDTSWVSDNVAGITGFTAEEYLSHPDFWRKRLHPEDREQVMRAFDSARETGSGDVEYRWLHKSGSYRWYQDRFVIREIGGNLEFLGLISDIHDHKMSRKRETLLYAISQASHTSVDLDELYKHLHEIVSELIPARNFYISLLSDDGKDLYFPYYVDEKETHQPTRPLGMGLTEYVLKTKSPLLISPQLYRELQEKEKIEIVGAQSHNWLGVPLVTEDKIIGVIAVQSYDPKEQYDENDRDILVFLSDQIAEAINRKRGQEALQESEAKHRQLLSSIALPVLSLKDDMTVYYCNQAYADFVGQNVEDMVGKKLLELFPYFKNTKSYQAYLECLETGKTKEVEGLMAEGVYLYARIYRTVNGLLAVCEDITERRRAEEALELSESRYRTTLDAVNEMIHVVDEGLNILLMNRTFTDYCKEYGLCDQCVGKNVFEIFPFLPINVKDEYRRVFDNKEAVFTEECNNVGGIPIYTNTRKIPIIEDGKVVRVVTIITDVTESVRQKEAIMESQEKYRSIYDNSNDGILLMKGDTFIDCNPALLKMFAMEKKEEILDKTPESISPNYQDNGLLSKEYAKQLIDEASLGQMLQFEWKHRKKTGEIFDCDISLNRLTLKGEYILMAILRDITEKRKNEAKLRENEERYSIVMEKTGQLVYDYNINTGSIKWAGASKDVTGYSLNELNAGIIKWEEELHPEDREYVLKQLNECLSATKAFDMEYRFRKADGSYIFVSDHGIYLPGPDGKAIKMLGTMEDITERKRINIALKQSEERYKTLFTDTLEPFSITRKGKIIDVNSAWLKLHGHNGKDEVIGRDILDIIFPQDRKFMEERRNQLYSNDAERIYEIRDVTKAGEIIDVEVSSSTITLDGEEVILSAIQNISQKKMDEKKIRDLNRRFEYVLGATKTGFDIIDSSHNIVYIDPEWQKEYGSHERVKCYEYFMGRKNVCDNCGIDKALATKKTTITEEYLVKENRWIEVHTIPFQSEDGEWQVAEFNIDITQRKQDQKIIENRQRALQEVYGIATSLDETFQGICDRVATNLSQLLNVPHMAVQLLKNGKINVISYYGEGKIKNDFIVPLEGTPCEKTYQEGKHLEVNGPLRQLFPTFFLNEMYDFNSYLGMPIKDKKGRILGLICIYDYREHRYTQEELILLEIFAHYIGYEVEHSEAEARLREADKGKLISDIASGVAHEVRNPLHAIQAITEAMAQDMKDNPNFSEYMMHIKTQVNRLSILMSELLELGKPVRTSAFRKEPIIDVITGAVNYWRDSQAEHHNRVIINNYTDSVKYVCVDMSKIQQVILNLLDNAAQHSPKEKDITIEFHQQGNEHLFVRIIDQGTGVKPHTEEQVFEPFYTTRKKGTGLGLAICKRIVENHGGNVQLANNENSAGCTVTFTLPIYSEDKDETNGSIG